MAKGETRMIIRRAVVDGAITAWPVRGRTDQEGEGMQPGPASVPPGPDREGGRARFRQKLSGRRESGDDRR